MEEKKAIEVCRHFVLGDTAGKLLTPELTAGKYLQPLGQNKTYIYAVRLLPYGLPPKESIVSGNSCARQFCEAHPAEKLSAAVDAVDRWLAQPSDENRRAALQAAEEAEFGTPAGSSALAVFLSGGSVAPADAPVIPPREYQAQNAVVGAVMLSVILKEPEKAEGKYQAFLDQGLKIAATVKS